MNDDFEKGLKKTLEQWDEPLPPSIEGRLRAARRTAMQTPVQRGGSKLVLSGLSLGLVAVVAVGVLNQQQPVLNHSPAEDMLMLTGGDEFELYDEIEFMLWLDEIGEADVG